MRSLRTRVTLLVVLVLLATLGALGLVFMRVTTSEVNRFLVTFEKPTTRVPSVELETVYRDEGLDGVIAKVTELAEAGEARLLVTVGDRVVASGDPRLAGANVSRDDEGGIVLESEGLRVKFNVSSVDLVDEAGLVVAEVYQLPDRGEQEDGRGLELVGPIHRWIAILIAGAAVVSVLLAVALLKGVTGPLEELTRAVRRMEQGDMTVRVEAKSKDETGVLAESFNSLADELERVEGLRRDMVSDIAHELRAPLTNIRCELEAVQDGVKPLDGERIESIHAEVLALGSLVDDLQDLAIADANQLNLEFEPVDLRRAMDQLIQRMSASAAERGVTLVVEGDEVEVSADPRRLEQVAKNLVANAIAHSPNPSVVKILVRRADVCGRVEVRDQGPGVPTAEQDRIFERFYREDRSRSRSTGGSGLGLAIARAIIEEHGGRIGVEQGDEGGACFWFEIAGV